MPIGTRGSEIVIRTKVTNKEFRWYLASRYWQDLRRRKIASLRGKCEGGCGRPIARVLHANFSHLGAETLGDLFATCGKCRSA